MGRNTQNGCREVGGGRVLWGQDPSPLRGPLQFIKRGGESCNPPPPPPGWGGGGFSALNSPGCVSKKVMDMGLFWAPSEWSEWTCFHSKWVSNLSLHSIWGVSLDPVQSTWVFSNPFLRFMYPISHWIWPYWYYC